MTQANEAGVERRTFKKVWLRAVPLMTFALFFNYLDKSNIGFAALQMNKALGLSNTVFGFGAGLFSVGYMLFAIPSSLLLYKFGTRRWMAFILAAWGAASAATAFVRDANELFVLRLLLGAAEAGFAPGAILYFSRWFPSAYRGRATGSFVFMMPISLMLGGPLSSVLLSYDGVSGLAGWQWLFLGEGLPAVLLAILMYVTLTEVPADARWLDAPEKSWLDDQLTRERQSIENSRSAKGFSAILSEPRVWLLLFVNLGLGTSAFGALIFLPLIIRSIGFSVVNTGLIAALPGFLACLSLPLWSLWTDRTSHREHVLACGCAGIAVGLLGTALLLPSSWALIPICIAMISFFGSAVPFWSLPPSFLTGASAAAGFAFINISGNLGPFFGPAILGVMSDLTGAYGAGLYCLAAVAAIAAGTALLYSPQGAREHRAALGH